MSHKGKGRESKKESDGADKEVVERLAPLTSNDEDDAASVEELRPYLDGDVVQLVDQSIHSHYGTVEGCGPVVVENNVDDSDARDSIVIEDGEVLVLWEGDPDPLTRKQKYKFDELHIVDRVHTMRCVVHCEEAIKRRALEANGTKLTREESLANRVLTPMVRRPMGVVSNIVRKFTITRVSPSGAPEDNSSVIHDVSGWHLLPLHPFQYGAHMANSVSSRNQSERDQYAGEVEEVTLDVLFEILPDTKGAQSTGTSSPPVLCVVKNADTVDFSGVLWDIDYKFAPGIVVTPNDDDYWKERGIFLNLSTIPKKAIKAKVLGVFVREVTLFAEHSEEEEITRKPRELTVLNLRSHEDFTVGSSVLYCPEIEVGNFKSRFELGNEFVPYVGDSDKKKKKKKNKSSHDREDSLVDRYLNVIERFRGRLYTVTESLSVVDVVMMDGTTYHDVDASLVWPVPGFMDDREFYVGDPVLSKHASLRPTDDALPTTSRVSVVEIQPVWDEEDVQVRDVVRKTDWRSEDQVMGTVVAYNVEDGLMDVRWHKATQSLEGEIEPQTIGEVVYMGMESTEITVLWANGKLSKCFPHEVEVLNLEDVDEEEEEEDYVDDEFEEDDESSEAVEDELLHSSDSHLTRQSSEDISEAVDGGEGTAPRESTSPTPRAARSLAAAATRVIGKVLGALNYVGGNHAAPHSGSSRPQTPTDTEPNTVNNAAHVGNEDTDVPAAPVPRSLTAAAVRDSEHADESSPTTPAPTKGTLTVVVSFRSHTLAEAVGSHNAARIRAIQKDWQVLQGSLPPGIHVKVAEDDMPLFKLALVGPAHTPYYEAFLCIDGVFPESYPQQPPTLSFHSYSYRINPNLYEDGKICLSLLGTWDGVEQCERWNPKSSNLLQVAVSIQGLILVKEPYYNEAGFEDKVGTLHGRKESRLYNEGAFLLRILLTMDMAVSPPEDWVFEFRAHYRKFTPKLIDRCRWYVDASRQSVDEGDNVQDNDVLTMDGLVLPLTKGFVYSLNRTVGKLAEQYDVLTKQWTEEEKRCELDFGDDED